MENNETEKIFTYNNTRCHAKIVKKRFGGEEHIGQLGGYDIYEIDPHSLFDQFGFIAVAKKRKRKIRRKYE